MPSNYTGNPLGSGAGSRVNPTIAVPSDGDARSAASIINPLDVLADYIAYLQQAAVLMSQMPVLGNGVTAFAPGSTNATTLLPVGTYPFLAALGINTNSFSGGVLLPPNGGPYPAVGSTYVIQDIGGWAATLAVTLSIPANSIAIVNGTEHDSSTVTVLPIIQANYGQVLLVYGGLSTGMIPIFYYH